MRVHQKIRFLRGERGHKKPIYRGELPERGGGGLGKFADLSGFLAKERGSCF